MPLLRNVGASFGPIVLETLVKHYFERLKNEAPDGKNTTQLRKDELLYDQAFSIVKNFLVVASNSTVEECQSFANTRTPSPPWVRVVRVMVPMSCCDEAAAHLIKALGGDEVVKRTVGGTKWWQVRGVEGVDSQWIVAKKDWREAKKRSKEQGQHKDRKQNASEKTNGSAFTDDDPDSGAYQEEMDEMRCILYAHGGGYYFGSVDQERYSIQRHARKMNGRVFAVNYRLAPQYPFPCALQDLLAAYIFLIQPPTGASHRAVSPAHIIFAGDSAGGGITLALLQVVRDIGLPLPAGAILVSPWCDLTHSFPSIHTNTKTDVIPEYGLSMQKPSTLWPPPSYEMTRKVHAGLRERIRGIVNGGEPGSRPKNATHRKSGSKMAVAVDRGKSGHDGMPIDVGTTGAAPPLNSDEKQPISVVTKSGETLTIEQQVHLYTQNSLIPHPLISPALSYLGGLPPLLFVVSDKEVLRDEGIYAAHKAANPSKYPIRDEIRAMYPLLEGIEERFGPTPVHLQVYDDAAHVLPVLFSFTTPAKYCFRAIATFCKQVTGMVPDPQSPISPISPIYPSPSPFSDAPKTTTPTEEPEGMTKRGSLFRAKSDIISSKTRVHNESTSGTRRKSLRRRMSQAAMAIRGNGSGNNSNELVPPVPKVPISKPSEDVAGPRFAKHQLGSEDQREAGDPIVYSDTPDFPSWNKGMIRERVATNGIVRPLEPESDLDAFHTPQEIIGEFSELAVRRYLDAQAVFSKKYSGVQKGIDKRRQRNLELAKKDINKNMMQLQGDVSKHPNEKKGMGSKSRGKASKGLKEGLQVASGSWAWAWALESDERPPPSSIVSRRDTEEARQLARIADQASMENDSSMSGNQLWSLLVDFLTSPPGKDKYMSTTQLDGNELGDESSTDVLDMNLKQTGKFSRFIPARKATALATGKAGEDVSVKT